MQAEILHPSQCILGESPLWHFGRKCCFWSDIENGVLYEYNWHTQGTRHWNFDQKLTLVLEGNDNWLIVALDTKIARFDLESGQLEWLRDIDDRCLSHRCNDGACDRLGRLWLGTMHLGHKEGEGALYCIDTSLALHKKIPNTTISNGIAWSPDNKRMYYIDSPTQVVQSFSFDEGPGGITFEKNAIQVPVEMGTPDGMAIDEEGMLWIAHWGGFGVYRWNPQNGELLGKVEVPVPQVSSCAFAGEDLSYLVITTASENLKEEQLKQYPQSGDTFFIKTAVKGMETNRCLL